MDDFLVLVITKNLFEFTNIAGFFEEEDSIIFVDTLNNVSGEVIALNAIAADLVVSMETWTNEKVFKRITKKVGTSYVECFDVEEVKEIIAEKFIEWPITNRANSIGIIMSTQKLLEVSKSDLYPDGKMFEVSFVKVKRSGEEERVYLGTEHLAYALDEAESYMMTGVVGG